MQRFPIDRPRDLSFSVRRSRGISVGMSKRLSGLKADDCRGNGIQEWIGDTLRVGNIVHSPYPDR